MGQNVVFYLLHVCLLSTERNWYRRSGGVQTMTLNFIVALPAMVKSCKVEEKARTDTIKFHILP